MKKVIVIGGGTGQSFMLKAIKGIDNIDLKTIVTVADDGGSTGRLRDIFDIPAVGDIRNVMIALSEDESLITKLMSYRFEKDKAEFANHNLGNLILVAAINNSKDFLDAIYQMSRFLKVKGEIIPATSLQVVLSAMMENGVVVDGEHNITAFGDRINRVFYKDKVAANPMAISAIEEADYIIYSIGSLYTSILPNLIIPDIQKALIRSKAKIIFFCNVMSEEGETTGYFLEDHVQAIVQHTGCMVDIAVLANDEIPTEILLSYKAENAHPIILKANNQPYQLIKHQLLCFDDGLIRHDEKKVREVLVELIK